MPTLKKEQIDQLRKEILRLQGLYAKPIHDQLSIDLGVILKHLPDQSFPLGVLHEFLSPSPEALAATRGFIATLLSSLIQKKGYGVWVSTHRTIYPPTLQLFGVAPEQVIFIDAAGDQEALWVVEEALKCKSVAAVIGEIKELDFAHSRRLQLAAENRGVTGFIHRLYPHKNQTTACVTRWKIQPAKSLSQEGLPGVGFPSWEVNLLKIRNGRPGRWELEWTGECYQVRAQANQKVSLSSLKSNTA